MLASHTNEDLPVFAGIQPAEFRRLGATLSLANRAIHDPDHVLHAQLVGQQDAHQRRLRSRRPFVPAVWKLLDSLSELDIRVKHPIGMESAQNILGKAQSLADWCRTFSFVHVQMGLAPSRIASAAPLSKLQITLYLRVFYIMYREKHKICRFWMMQLNAGLRSPLPASNLGSAAARGGKRINPRPWF